jgi:hypothetical protein
MVGAVAVISESRLVSKVEILIKRRTRGVGMKRVSDD